MRELTQNWRKAGLTLAVLGTAAALAPARAQTVVVPVPTAQPQAVVVPGTVRAQVIIAPTAPPPAQVEVIPPAPNTSVVWQPGRQTWNGTGWTLQPGHETWLQAVSARCLAAWQPPAAAAIPGWATAMSVAATGETRRIAPRDQGRPGRLRRSRCRRRRRPPPWWSRRSRRP